jgi:hypothetical protein
VGGGVNRFVWMIYAVREELGTPSWVCQSSEGPTFHSSVKREMWRLIDICVFTKKMWWLSASALDPLPDGHKIESGVLTAYVWLFNSGELPPGWFLVIKNDQRPTKQQNNQINKWLGPASHCFFFACLKNRPLCTYYSVTNFLYCRWGTTLKYLCSCV